MSTPYHIVILCSHLNKFGGYERILANTASFFAEKGEQITLLILNDTADSYFPLHKNVQLIKFPLSFGITQKGNMFSRKLRMFSDILALRKKLKELKVSLVICSEFEYSVVAILGNMNKKIKIVAWEHEHFNVRPKNKFWNAVFKYTYPRLDAIICLNEDEKKLFRAVNKNVIVIPNFVNHSTNFSSLLSKTIISVNRLTEMKGITHLLQIAKLVLKKYPDWQWKIIGEGEMQKNVTEFIEKENLQPRLILQKPVDHNIHPEYQNASMYVMTSLIECFPMVLLEALSNGLPCIAFDCDTGPRNIIIHNEDGLLVENENRVKLAEAISSLINNDEIRKKMGLRAIANVKRFCPEAIYQIWKKEVFNIKF